MFMVIFDPWLFNVNRVLEIAFLGGPHRHNQYYIIDCVLNYISYSWLYLICCLTSLLCRCWPFYPLRYGTLELYKGRAKSGIKKNLILVVYVKLFVPISCLIKQLHKLIVALKLLLSMRAFSAKWLFIVIWH